MSLRQECSQKVLPRRPLPGGDSIRFASYWQRRREFATFCRVHLSLEFGYFLRQIPKGFRLKAQGWSKRLPWVDVRCGHNPNGVASSFWRAARKQTSLAAKRRNPFRVENVA